MRKHFVAISKISLFCVSRCIEFHAIFYKWWRLEQLSLRLRPERASIVACISLVRWSICSLHDLCLDRVLPSLLQLLIRDSIHVEFWSRIEFIKRKLWESLDALAEIEFKKNGTYAGNMALRVCKKYWYKDGINVNNKVWNLYSFGRVIKDSFLGTGEKQAKVFWF